MLPEEDVKAINRTLALIEFVKHEGDDIFKIIGLVQDNHEFFNVKLGSSCLRAAVNKLEELIEESKL